MIKRTIYKMLKGIHDIKPLQEPSNQELKLAAELIATVRSVPEYSTKNLSLSELSWINHMNRLRELVLNKDPRKFLWWSVIQDTMFVSYSNYVSAELKYLKNRPDWKKRWSNAIKEDQIGHPFPFLFYPSSSGNLIHNAYHLAQFEEINKIKLEKIDFIFEFGGGYGSLCRLFYNLGYQGTYILFDLPIFSALQKYYLKSLGFPVYSAAEFEKSKTGIICISDIHELKALTTKHNNSMGNAMFVATWSMSEAPISVRNSILPLISDFKLFLIAYQDRFGEVDNIDYFNRFKSGYKKISWHNWQIQHIPENNYLMGRAGNN